MLPNNRVAITRIAIAEAGQKMAPELTGAEPEDELMSGWFPGWDQCRYYYGIPCPEPRRFYPRDSARLMAVTADSFFYCVFEGGPSGFPPRPLAILEQEHHWTPGTSGFGASWLWWHSGTPQYPHNPIRLFLPVAPAEG